MTTTIDVATTTSNVSGRDNGQPPERPQNETLGFYLLMRAWLLVALLALGASCIAIIPVPSLDFWFFKIFVLSGVFHATFLTLVSLAAALSAVVVSTGKRRNRRPSLCAAALGCFILAGGIAAFPAVVNIPLAAHLPARVDEFLTASNLTFIANHRVRALDLAEFLVDPPCALANVWEYYEHTHEIVYKQIPESTVEKTGIVIEDWSGFGGLSNRDNEHGLRLAIFGTHTKNNLDIHTECQDDDCRALKPVVLSLHGGGWYRGSLYDGLQCYLPAALATGAAVVAAEYRSGAEGWSGRDMVDDAIDAIEWIMEHGATHGLDTSKLVVMGGSAGAHVGITAAYLLNKKYGRELVRGVVARYGAIGDLSAAHANPSALPQGLGGGNGWSEKVALEHIARGTPSEVGSEYSYLSPLSHIDKFSPPTVMLHCRHDEFYDLHTHAVALSDALALAKRPHLLIAPHLHGHGCDIGSTAPFQLLRFALVHLLDSLKREKKEGFTLENTRDLTQNITPVESENQTLNQEL
jgi:acetyl esterase/lipase